MRPRTATIQVVKDKNFWRVEIGNPGAATYDVIKVGHEGLSVVLVEAILEWQIKENLDV